jgi:hypothetical protein
MNRPAHQKRLEQGDEIHAKVIQRGLVSAGIWYRPISNLIELGELAEYWDTWH